jgi:AraC family transcriptional regulator
MEISPKIENLPERHVAFVSFTGNYIANSKVFENLFDKLCGWAGPKGLLKPDVIMLSSYQDDPKITPLEELTVDVCMTAPEDVEVSGEVRKKILPGGQYAVANVELDGPQEYGLAWEAVVGWSMQNNLQIDIARPSYEIYKNSPKEHPQGNHILDICLSIKSV